MWSCNEDNVSQMLPGSSLYSLSWLPISSVIFWPVFPGWWNPWQIIYDNHIYSVKFVIRWDMFSQAAFRQVSSFEAICKAYWLTLEGYILKALICVMKMQEENMTDRQHGCSALVCGSPQKPPHICQASPQWPPHWSVPSPLTPRNARSPPYM